MTDEQTKIIDQIKAHMAIVNELLLKLEIPIKTKSKKGLTPEENARLDAKLRKKMYR